MKVITLELAYEVSEKEFGLMSPKYAFLGVSIGDAKAGVM